MIEQADLDAAVTAGVVSSEQRDALTAFVRDRRQAQHGADEENFRLVTSFNDIFVTIAAVLLLAALGGLGGQMAPALGAVLVAGASWGLAEYFTRRRRMALPSIVLLLAFVGGAAGTAGAFLGETLGLFARVQGPGFDSPELLVFCAAGVTGAAAAFAHWRRFAVPITMAAGAASLAGIAVALVAFLTGGSGEAILATVAVAGLGVFALAMRFDVSDRARTTRRTDVAFWLHLLAAPMIIHPLFVLLGVEREALSAAGAAGIVATYLALTVVAVAIDRRALLVSALVYMVWAIQTLVTQTGAVEIGVSLTALVVGLFLLTLSALWQGIRAKVVAGLPSDLAARLPVAA